jgi:hypothetical protein
LQASESWEFPTLEDAPQGKLFLRIWPLEHFLCRELLRHRCGLKLVCIIIIVILNVSNYARKQSRYEK